MLMSQDNKYNSTLKQILLDAIVEYPELNKQINDFMNLFTDNMCTKVDDRFNRHQYPTTKITYNRVSNLETCPELQKLLQVSKDAYIIFKMLIDINKSPNNLVSIPLHGTDKFVDVCNLQYLTGIRIKNIRAAIKVLVEYDFLRIYKQHQGTNPTVYMINPKYSITAKEQITKWNELKKGLGEFDYIPEYQTQLIPNTEQKFYYDDDNNEVEYIAKYKLSKLTVPDPVYTSEAIKYNALNHDNS